MPIEFKSLLFKVSYFRLNAFNQGLSRRAAS